MARTRRNPPEATGTRALPALAKSLQIAPSSTPTSTPENRGVPGSSRGLAIWKRRWKSAPFFLPLGRPKVSFYAPLPRFMAFVAGFLDRAICRISKSHHPANLVLAWPVREALADATLYESHLSTLPFCDARVGERSRRRARVGPRPLPGAIADRRRQPPRRQGRRPLARALGQRRGPAPGANATRTAHGRPQRLGPPAGGLR